MSFKRSCPGSPSSKNLKTSFQIFMVLLGFARLIASLRDKRINPDSLFHF